MTAERQRLPASPAEIRKVLVAMEQLARSLQGERDIQYTGELAGDHGRVLHGLVLGFEGTVFPLPDDKAADIGYRVGVSLTRGGSPWL